MQALSRPDTPCPRETYPRSCDQPGVHQGGGEGRPRRDVWPGHPSRHVRLRAYNRLGDSRPTPAGSRALAGGFLPVLSQLRPELAKGRRTDPRVKHGRASPRSRPSAGSGQAENPPIARRKVRRRTAGERATRMPIEDLAPSRWLFLCFPHEAPSITLLFAGRTGPPGPRFVSSD